MLCGPRAPSRSLVPANLARPATQDTVAAYSAHRHDARVARPCRANSASPGLPSKVPPSPSARARRKTRKRVAQGVQSWAALADAPGAQVVEVQPLLQVAAADGYAAFRDGWTAAWRKQANSYTTAVWPMRLEVGEVAVLLLPLAAGRVGAAIGRHPRVVSRPLMLSGHPPQGRDFEDVCVAALETWLRLPTGKVAPVLAPPVIEVLQHGRASRRYVQQFEVEWPLPAPDGL